ncbi:alpha/beta fold hydrolase [Sphaerisporangium corydalis]|uniref:Alpha/beta fold hydrolase n=1 Tax=Sphaerisporangium corydalis TaxID=1441875 RepID=A0ABV9EGT4_9ACTN|nr:alpha/beta hydrolase [Sphaerisporangium corydalis]
MEIGTLTVPGARIHYEVRGAGPVLLLVNGGEGDAAMYGQLAALLADRYTVVTYDLRGNSRSRLTVPPYEQHIAEHADDAHRLLGSIGDEPAYVFGSSYGGMIGMDLLARHPERVRALVAHEPFVIEMLPDAARWHAVFQEVYEIHRRDGAGAATRRFVTEIGVAAPPEPSPGLPAPVLELLARVAANLETCYEYELRSFTRFVPDLPALRGGRVVVAGGADSREALPHRAATALAERLGTPVVEFPGDHAGFVMRPAEFAEALHGVLDDGSRPLDGPTSRH